MKSLPKTDLHLHLDGSLRLQTLLDLASQQNVRLPADDIEGLKKLVVCSEKTESLDDYLKSFHIVNLVLQTEPALYRAAYELAEDSAKENALYIEVRFAPFLHTQNGLSSAAVIEAVVAGLMDARKDFGIKSGLIICGIRNLSSELSLEMAELATRYKGRGVVAFDLAGGEYQNPAVVHRKAFALAKEHNLNITVHAGEADGALSIKQAIHDCGARRIGHGTRLIEDIDLMNFVIDHQIPLEVCLTSNFHTKATPSIAAHPFAEYLKRGVKVTVNTDNRTVSNTTLSDEYLAAAMNFDLGFEEIKRIVLNGFESAFLAYSEKLKLIDKAKQILDNIKK